MSENTSNLSNFRHDICLLCLTELPYDGIFYPDWVGLIPPIKSLRTSEKKSADPAYPVCKVKWTISKAP